MTATILIVDDEENALRNISAFLEPKGYEVILATNLAEARASLQRGEPEIVLLDVQLPDGYGPDLLEETAHLPNRPPIILITAFGEIEMAVEAMKNGAHDFLQKPIQLEQLHQSIKRAEEIMTQMFEKSLRIDRVVCASGSTGTHAGLVTGFHGNNGNIPVIGVNVSRKEEILDKSKLEV